MNSEEIEARTFKETKISSTDEDKKFVSQAVAFVIGHTRNGSMVPLCASIATLFKDQTRLKLENENLKQQISELKSQLIVQSSGNNKTTIATINWKSEEKKKFKASQSYKFSRIKLQQKGFKSLKDCLCNTCVNDTSNSALSAPLKKGDKVVISGELSGTVCYVGHVEKFSSSEIFVGLHLDEAVGDCDGSIGMKTYFKAPPGCGLFAPLLNVRCLIN